TDPGQDVVTAFSVNWGDGVTENLTPQQLLDVQGVLHHVYPDGPASPVVTVSLTDNDGVHVAGGIAVDVRNVRPSIDDVQRDDVTDEGSTFGFAATASDVAGIHDPLTYTWNFGDGTDPVSEVDLTEVFREYADSGEYVVHLTVDDGDGGEINQFFDVVVENVAPTLTLSTNTPVADEGGPFVLQLSSSDPGDDVISQWDINWGDGSVEVVAGNPASVTHAYADDGVYAITATATDDDGVYNAGNSAPATVTHVAPTLAPISTDNTRSNKSVVGREISVAGRFTDVGLLDTHTIIVQWDDDSVSNSDLNPGEFSDLDVDGGGPGSFIGIHTYTTGGIFEVVVTVIDDDTGESNSSTVEVWVSGVRLTSDGELQIIGTAGKDIVNVDLVRGRDGNSDGGSDGGKDKSTALTAAGGLLHASTLTADVYKDTLKGDKGRDLFFAASNDKVKDKKKDEDLFAI
ncbi:MAG: PKD domain-containing protein, partial [Fuerstiella sp.]|nr:PKD domain-containing protein [Fuerstiella sp.]